MKVLHISNDYSGSTVYKNLCSSLDYWGIEQIIYTPIQKSLGAGRNRIKFKNVSSDIIYRPILSLYTRVDYKSKVKRILNDLNNYVDLSHCNMIHAHTWYSDGGVAYELYKKHNIPYIITIRNTDLNLFFKYMLHLRSYGLEILRNAKKIIFISAIYQKRFFENVNIQKHIGEFQNKCQIQPNGIDDFWIENVGDRKSEISKPVELLYIGRFTKGKNVPRLMQAVELLNDDRRKVNLTIVGSGGKDEKKVLNFIKMKDFFTYLGEIRDKNDLKKIINKSDIFTMPSKSETFGLVYIEALSQGIPVVYTKDEGIDGFYGGNIGEAVNATDVDSIVDGILKIVNNYSNYDFNPNEIIANHDWKTIAKKYITIYKNENNIYSSIF